MDNQKFKELLDESYQWHDYYEFKFIVKTDDKHLILDKLDGFTLSETPSKKRQLYLCQRPKTYEKYSRSPGCVRSG